MIVVFWIDPQVVQLGLNTALLTVDENCFIKTEEPLYRYQFSTITDILKF